MGILLVGPEQDVFGDSRSVLASQGWEVQGVAASDCIDRAARESFEVAILDVRPDEEGGLLLLEEIHRRSPATQVIAVTHAHAPSLVRRIMQAGAFDCLEAPVSAQQIGMAIESALRAHSALTFPTSEESETDKPHPRFGIRVKPELCRACLACTVACAYKNLGLPWETPLRIENLAAADISIEGAGDYAVPLVCMQCSDGTCMTVCPTHSLRRHYREGPVYRDAETCIGCHRCVLACTLGVLRVNQRSHIVQKCDMCMELTVAGKAPACVEACPQDALEFVTMDDEVAATEMRHLSAATPLGINGEDIHPVHARRAMAVGEMTCVDEIIRRYSGNVGFLIPILQDIQRELGYLPVVALRQLAGEMGLPLSRIYNVATFYSSLSLKPRGRHVVSVCTGTVCHLKGSGRLADAICEELQIPTGGTTKDLRFSFETVNCLGACALAPVVVVDGQYYAEVQPSSVSKILREYK